MIIAGCAMLALLAIVYLWASGRVRQSRLRIVLLISYATCIAQCVDVEYAVSVADDKNLDGGKAGWLGSHWMLGLFVNVLVVVVLHVLLYEHRRANEQPNT